MPWNNLSNSFTHTKASPNMTLGKETPSPLVDRAVSKWSRFALWEL
jgi:hypothetical protein